MKTNYDSSERSHLRELLRHQKKEMLVDYLTSFIDLSMCNNKDEETSSPYRNGWHDSRLSLLKTSLSECLYMYVKEIYNN